MRRRVALSGGRKGSRGLQERSLAFWTVCAVLVGSAVGCAKQLPVANVTVDAEARRTFTRDPAPVPDYAITTADELAIAVYRRSDLTPLFDIRGPVAPDGRVSVPLIGEVTAAGLTPGQLRRRITEEMSQYIVSPVVNVMVARTTRAKIYVLGEVKTPGVYRIEPDTSALEALALAGGLTRDANTQTIVLMRTESTGSGDTRARSASVNFDDLVTKADLRQNVVLRGGDVLYVPPDYVAETGRILNFVATAVSPVFQTLGILTQIILLSR